MRICVLTDEELVDFDPSPFLEGFDFEIVTMTDPVMDVLRALDARKEFDLPFTGAPSRFFDPTREEMQAAADAHGVGFAKGYQVKSVEEAERLVKNLRYPIMVKH